jgi:hypothetical protein
MNELDEAGLAEALVEVRRSYRVVVAFQRRINEIFHRFHLKMSDAGLSFVEWYPVRNNAPGRSKNIQFAPHKWAWDLFPGYSLQAVWRQDGPPAVQVILSLVTDTGWKKPSSGEPDPRDFGPVEEGSTQLWVSRSRADAGTPGWDRVWNESVKSRWKEGWGKDLRWELEGYRGSYRTDAVGVEKLTGGGQVEELLFRPVLEWLKVPSVEGSEPKPPPATPGSS